MDFESLVTAMSSETYQKLADAVATGRWADGSQLSEQQRAQSMQLVMAYQARVLRSDEPFTIGADGQMVTKSKAEMKMSWQQQSAIASFKHDDL
ncbi:MAG: YeaC family protein [Alkalimonas sp.]|nr:YeaC family protein [Alkalimonas sp.]